jgi:hypothetical protein
MKICQQQLCCKPANYTTCYALIKLVLLMSLFIFRHFCLSIIICLGLDFQQLILLCELWADFFWFFWVTFARDYRLLFSGDNANADPLSHDLLPGAEGQCLLFLYILSLFFASCAHVLRVQKLQVLCCWHSSGDADGMINRHFQSHVREPGMWQKI